MAGNPIHSDPGYKRSRTVGIALAYVNPETKCGRCDRTLAEHGNDAKWDWGHDDDHPGDWRFCRPEVASCNRSAGATAGNIARERRPVKW